MEFLGLLITPVMLIGAWISGGILERRHLKGLLLLESGSRGVLAVTIEDLPPNWHVESSELVMGNVVISQDYFKRFAASIKGIFGGNIRVFESLLERARRECRGPGRPAAAKTQRDARAGHGPGRDQR